MRWGGWRNRYGKVALWRGVVLRNEANPETAMRHAVVHREDETRGWVESGRLYARGSKTVLSDGADLRTCDVTSCSVTTTSVVLNHHSWTHPNQFRPMKTMDTIIAVLSTRGWIRRCEHYFSQHQVYDSGEEADFGCHQADSVF